MCSYFLMLEIKSLDSVAFLDEGTFQEGSQALQNLEVWLLIKWGSVRFKIPFGGVEG